MEDRQQEAKRAWAIRTEYNRDTEFVQAWIQSAEAKVQNKSVEPHTLNECLQEIHCEVGTISDQLDRICRNGAIIVEHTNSPHERELVSKTMSSLTDQLNQVKNWLEDKKSQVGDSLDSWQAFIQMYNSLRGWIERQKNFLVEPLKFSTLAESRAKLQEYLAVVKECKWANKQLIEMNAELGKIGQVSNVGPLAEKQVEIEQEKSECESKLKEVMALLQEMAEEWEQCERKSKDVATWIEKTRQLLDNPQNKKRSLRDQLTAREKALADVTIQKTKMTMAMEKLQVHFRDRMSANTQVSHENEMLQTRLEELQEELRKDCKTLEACVHQIDVYQQEIHKLRQNMVGVEQQLRLVSGPTYSPRDREKAISEQSVLQGQYDSLQRQTLELIERIFLIDPLQAISTEQAFGTTDLSTPGTVQASRTTEVSENVGFCKEVAHDSTDLEISSITMNDISISTPTLSSSLPITWADVAAGRRSPAVFIPKEYQNQEYPISTQVLPETFITHEPIQEVENTHEKPKVTAEEFVRTTAKPVPHVENKEKLPNYQRQYLPSSHRTQIPETYSASRRHMPYQKDKSTKTKEHIEPVRYERSDRARMRRGDGTRIFHARGNTRSSESFRGAATPSYRNSPMRNPKTNSKTLRPRPFAKSHSLDNPENIQRTSFETSKGRHNKVYYDKEGRRTYAEILKGQMEARMSASSTELNSKETSFVDNLQVGKDECFEEKENGSCSALCLNNEKAHKEPSKESRSDMKNEDKLKETAFELSKEVDSKMQIETHAYDALLLESSTTSLPVTSSTILEPPVHGHLFTPEPTTSTLQSFSDLQYRQTLSTDQHLQHNYQNTNNQQLSQHQIVSPESTFPFEDHQNQIQSKLNITHLEIMPHFISEDVHSTSFSVDKSKFVPSIKLKEAVSVKTNRPKEMDLTNKAEFERLEETNQPDDAFNLSLPPQNITIIESEMLSEVTATESEIFAEALTGIDPSKYSYAQILAMGLRGAASSYSAAFTTGPVKAEVNYTTKPSYQRITNDNERESDIDVRRKNNEKMNPERYPYQERSRGKEKSITKPVIQISQLSEGESSSKKLDKYIPGLLFIDGSERSRSKSEKRQKTSKNELSLSEEFEEQSKHVFPVQTGKQNKKESKPKQGRSSSSRRRRSNSRRKEEKKKEISESLFVTGKDTTPEIGEVTINLSKVNTKEMKGATPKENLLDRKIFENIISTRFIQQQQMQNVDIKEEESKGQTILDSSDEDLSQKCLDSNQFLKPNSKIGSDNLKTDKKKKKKRSKPNLPNEDELEKALREIAEMERSGQIPPVQPATTIAEVPDKFNKKSIRKKKKNVPFSMPTESPELKEKSKCDNVLLEKNKKNVLFKNAKNTAEVYNMTKQKFPENKVEQTLSHQHEKFHTFDGESSSPKVKEQKPIKEVNHQKLKQEVNHQKLKQEVNHQKLKQEVHPSLDKYLNPNILQGGILSMEQEMYSTLEENPHLKITSDNKTKHSISQAATKISVSSLLPVTSENVGQLHIPKSVDDQINIPETAGQICISETVGQIHIQPDVDESSSVNDPELFICDEDAKECWTIDEDVSLKDQVTNVFSKEDNTGSPTMEDLYETLISDHIEILTESSDTIKQESVKSPLNIASNKITLPSDSETSSFKVPFNLPMPDHASDWMDVIREGGFTLDSDEDDSEEKVVLDKPASGAGNFIPTVNLEETKKNKLVESIPLQAEENVPFISLDDDGDTIEPLSLKYEFLNTTKQQQHMMFPNTATVIDPPDVCLEAIDSDEIDISGTERLQELLPAELAPSLGIGQTKPLGKDDFVEDDWIDVTKDEELKRYIESERRELLSSATTNLDGGVVEYALENVYIPMETNLFKSEYAFDEVEEALKPHFNKPALKFEKNTQQELRQIYGPNNSQIIALEGARNVFTQGQPNIGEELPLDIEVAEEALEICNIPANDNFADCVTKKPDKFEAIPSQRPLESICEKGSIESKSFDRMQDPEEEFSSDKSNAKEEFENLQNIIIEDISQPKGKPREAKSFNLPMPEHVSDWMEVIEEGGFTLDSDEDIDIDKEIEQDKRDNLPFVTESKINDYGSTIDLEAFTKESTPSDLIEGVPLVQQNITESSEIFIEGKKDFEVDSQMESVERGAINNVLPKNKDENKSEDVLQKVAFNLPIPDHADDWMELIKEGGFTLDSDDETSHDKLILTKNDNTDKYLNSSTSSEYENTSKSTNADSENSSGNILSCDLHDATQASNTIEVQGKDEFSTEKLNHNKLYPVEETDFSVLNPDGVSSALQQTNIDKAQRLVAANTDILVDPIILPVPECTISEVLTICPLIDKSSSESFTDVGSKSVTSQFFDSSACKSKEYETEVDSEPCKIIEHIESINPIFDPELIISDSKYATVDVVAPHLYAKCNSLDSFAVEITESKIVTGVTDVVLTKSESPHDLALQHINISLKEQESVKNREKSFASFNVKSGSLNLDDPNSVVLTPQWMRKPVFGTRNRYDPTPEKTMLKDDAAPSYIPIHYSNSGQHTEILHKHSSFAEVDITDSVLDIVKERRSLPDEENFNISTKLQSGQPLSPSVLKDDYYKNKKKRPKKEKGKLHSSTETLHEEDFKFNPLTKGDEESFTHEEDFKFNPLTKGDEESFTYTDIATSVSNELQKDKEIENIQNDKEIESENDKEIESENFVRSDEAMILLDQNEKTREIIDYQYSPEEEDIWNQVVEGSKEFSIKYQIKVASSIDGSSSKRLNSSDDQNNFCDTQPPAAQLETESYANILISGSPVPIPDEAELPRKPYKFRKPPSVIVEPKEESKTNLPAVDAEGFVPYISRRDAHKVKTRSTSELTREIEDEVRDALRQDKVTKSSKGKYDNPFSSYFDVLSQDVTEPEKINSNKFHKTKKSPELSVCWSKSAEYDKKLKAAFYLGEELYYDIFGIRDAEKNYHSLLQQETDNIMDPSKNCDALTAFTAIELQNDIFSKEETKTVNEKEFVIDSVFLPVTEVDNETMEAYEPTDLDKVPVTTFGNLELNNYGHITQNINHMQKVVTANISDTKMIPVSPPGSPCLSEVPKQTDLNDYQTFIQETKAMLQVVTEAPLLIDSEASALPADTKELFVSNADSNTDPSYSSLPDYNIASSSSPNYTISSSSSSSPIYTISSSSSQLPYLESKNESIEVAAVQKESDVNNYLNFLNSLNVTVDKTQIKDKTDFDIEADRISFYVKGQEEHNINNYVKFLNNTEKEIQIMSKDMFNVEEQEESLASENQSKNEISFFTSEEGKEIQNDGSKDSSLNVEMQEESFLKADKQLEAEINNYVHLLTNKDTEMQRNELALTMKSESKIEKEFFIKESQLAKEINPLSEFILKSNLWFHLTDYDMAAINEAETKYYEYKEQEKLDSSNNYYLRALLVPKPTAEEPLKEDEKRFILLKTKTVQLVIKNNDHKLYDLPTEDGDGFTEFVSKQERRRRLKSSCSEDPDDTIKDLVLYTPRIELPEMFVDPRESIEEITTQRDPIEGIPTSCIDKEIVAESQQIKHVKSNTPVEKRPNTYHHKRNITNKKRHRSRISETEQEVNDILKKMLREEMLQKYGSKESFWHGKSECQDSETNYYVNLSQENQDIFNNTEQFIKYEPTKYPQDHEAYVEREGNIFKTSDVTELKEAETLGKTHDNGIVYSYTVTNDIINESENLTLNKTLSVSPEISSTPLSSIFPYDIASILRSEKNYYEIVERGKPRKTIHCAESVVIDDHNGDLVSLPAQLSINSLNKTEKKCLNALSEVSLPEDCSSNTLTNDKCEVNLSLEQSTATFDKILFSQAESPYQMYLVDETDEFSRVGNCCSDVTTEMEIKPLNNNALKTTGPLLVNHTHIAEPLNVSFVNNNGLKSHPEKDDDDSNILTNKQSIVPYDIIAMHHAETRYQELLAKESKTSWADVVSQAKPKEQIQMMKEPEETAFIMLQTKTVKLVVSDEPMATPPSPIVDKEGFVEYISKHEKRRRLRSSCSEDNDDHIREVVPYVPRIELREIGIVEVPVILKNLDLNAVETNDLDLKEEELSKYSSRKSPSSHRNRKRSSNPSKTEEEANEMMKNMEREDLFIRNAIRDLFLCDQWVYSDAETRYQEMISMETKKVPEESMLDFTDFSDDDDNNGPPKPDFTPVSLPLVRPSSFGNRDSECHFNVKSHNYNLPCGFTNWTDESTYLAINPMPPVALPLHTFTDPSNTTLLKHIQTKTDNKAILLDDCVGQAPKLPVSQKKVITKENSEASKLVPSVLPTPLICEMPQDKPEPDSSPKELSPKLTMKTVQEMEDRTDIHETGTKVSSVESQIASLEKRIKALVDYGIIEQITILKKLIFEMSQMENELAILDERGKEMSNDPEMLNMFAAISGTRTKLRAMKASAISKENEIRVHYSKSIYKYSDDVKDNANKIGVSESFSKRETRSRSNSCNINKTRRSTRRTVCENKLNSSIGFLPQVPNAAYFHSDNVKAIIIAIQFIAVFVCVISLFNFWI